MSNRVVLPIQENPPYQSYQEPAFFLGILLNNPNYYNKFYNGYINLNYDKKLNWLNMCYPKYNWYTYDNCDFDIESIVIKGNPYNISEEDPYLFLVNLMKNELCRGYYVNGFGDEFYFSKKKNYNKVHCFHDFLVYGFNDNEEIFYSIGYKHNGCYGPFKISYSEMYNALIWRQENGITNNSSNLAKYEFIKEKPNRLYCIDKNTIVAELNNYLMSKQLSNKQDLLFGIKAFDMYCQSLPNSFDLKCIRLIKEHKEIMYNRIQYLDELGIIDANSLLLPYQKIKIKSEIIFNIAIKIAITGNKKEIYHIQDMLIGLSNDEIIILEELKQLLEK